MWRSSFGPNCDVSQIYGRFPEMARGKLHHLYIDDHLKITWETGSRSSSSLFRVYILYGIIYIIMPSTFWTNSRLALVFSFVLFFVGRFRPSQQNSSRLPTIYWNASNPIFSSSSSSSSSSSPAQTSDTHPFLPHRPHLLVPPVINVRFGESIDIFCPLFTHDQTQRLQYYTLYQVTKEEFHSCLITKLNNKVTKWIFDCKQPFDINA